MKTTHLAAAAVPVLLTLSCPTPVEPFPFDAWTCEVTVNVHDRIGTGAAVVVGMVVGAVDEVLEPDGMVVGAVDEVLEVVGMVVDVEVVDVAPGPVVVVTYAGATIGTSTRQSDTRAPW